MAQKDLIPRLLSRRDELSRIEKDEILEHVFAAVAPPGRRRRIQKPWLAVGLGLAGAAAVLFMIPKLSSTSRTTDETFTARGEHGKPSFRVRCIGASGETRCRAGSKLVFEVTPGDVTSFFAAFARRDDATVVWYFPDTATDKSRDLSRGLVRGILETGIEMGVEHGPGNYEIYGVFSDHPMDRTEVKAFINSEGPTAGTVLVKQKVIIE